MMRRRSRAISGAGSRRRRPWQEHSAARLGGSDGGLQARPQELSTQGRALHALADAGSRACRRVWPSDRAGRPRWRGLVAGVVLACAVAAQGCSNAPATRVLVLGATLPLTGTDAEVGAAMRRGYERAVDEASRAGGIAVGSASKLPVRLDLRDDGSEAARAERLALELLSGECHVLLATTPAIRAATQAAVAEQVGKPVLVSSDDADAVPGTRARWTFSVPVSGDPETRAYETARLALRAFGTARGGDPSALRYALLP